MVSVSGGVCFGFWELGVGEGFHEGAEVGGGAAEVARHRIEVRDDGKVYFWW